MKHYKDPSNNEVWAYELDGSQDHLIPSSFVAITDAEAAVLSEAFNKMKSDMLDSNLTWKQKRVLEYPEVGDQLDALFKAGLMPPDMAAKIQAVKDKYPKP